MPTPSQTVKKKVLPTPGSLSSQMRPPMSSTRRRQMVRPRPVPPCLRVVDMSACVNGWNSFADCSRAHADAGVAHGELELHLLAGAFEQFDVEPDLAPLGELDGVVDEVGKNLAQPKRVAQQALRNAGRDVGQELEPLFVRLLGREGGDGGDDFVQLELGGFEVELAGLDLGEVENVVDDGEQRGAGVVNLGDVIALLGR